MTERQHTPVLLNEVLDALAPKDGGRYLDGTFGRGGYSRAILAAAECQVYAIDRDPEAVTAGRALEAEAKGRFTMLAGRFGEMEELLPEEAKPLDGITLDLGLSSPQIDDAARGFSFRGQGPLDMRMGKDSAGEATARELVNELPEKELADLIYRFGEERRSRQVARAIVAARPIETTLQLADIVRRAVGRSHDGIDPATRTFQALRIAVNDELGEIDRGLAAAERILAPGGRLAVVAFHSLEDRAVKTFLATRSEGAAQASRHAPLQNARQATFRLLFKGAVKPGADEIRANPRSQSARLRAATRLSSTGGQA